MPQQQPVSGIKHPAYQDALALTRPSGRAETGRYLVEGADLVSQALASPSPVFVVFALPGEADALAAPCAARKAPLYVLGSSGLMGKLVGTGYETAVTALAIVGQRRVSPDALITDHGGNALVLAGERIQDPRNVGVLVRTAEAAGCAGLLLSSDSAEPFSRQAVRSTTGSILRLPVSLSDDLPGALAGLRERHGAPIIATSARAEHLAWEADLSRRPLVIVVGNETEGISDAVRHAASSFIRLPMAPNGASSLNVTVAAGVLLYETVRQASTPKHAD
jgi:TrmH family RNA methyltransferase